MLSRRDRVRLRNFGRHFRGRRRACRCEIGDCISLADLETGKEALITCNNDLKTIERGLYHGKRVIAQRNEPGEPNIVVAVGDARYVLDRRVAWQIRVKVV
ncbi:MAG: FeoA family protein [Candidatus Cloacimonetes bacterium]|nr:ferrous iron transport protein A [Candidatus Cloacimonadota bacterium]MDD4224033.1 FeoA family protein [Candidatus Cloacimonadota bacterium]